MIYVTYDYEFVGPIVWKHMGDGGFLSGQILIICPTCLYGLSFNGLEAITAYKKIQAKAQGAAIAARDAIEAEAKLNDVQKRFDMKLTQDWHQKLNFLAKRSHLKTLRRIGLLNVAQHLGG